MYEKIKLLFLFLTFSVETGFLRKCAKQPHNSPFISEACRNYVCYFLNEFNNTGWQIIVPYNHYYLPVLPQMIHKKKNNILTKHAELVSITYMLKTNNYA